MEELEPQDLEDLPEFSHPAVGSIAQAELRISETSEIRSHWQFLAVLDLEMAFRTWFTGDRDTRWHSPAIEASRDPCTF